jgi:ABC-type sulfate/molybdate transport systems ATPase subunit
MIVSHAPEEFLDEADRVLVLHSASVAWYGDANALLREPSALVRSGLTVPDVAAVQLEVGRRLGVDVDPVLDVGRAAVWIENAIGGWSS